METFIVELNRPNKTSTWGFSIQGGKDFGCPLSVLRVTPNSISDKMAIRVEDLIIKINDIPTDTLTHQQAILQIQNLNVKLELARNGKTDSALPPPPPLVGLENFNANCRISTSITELPPPPPEVVLLCTNNNPVNVKSPPYIKDDETESTQSNPTNTKNNNKINEPYPVVGLGQFLQSQDQDKQRDNKDLLVQKTNFGNNVAICSVCKEHIKGAYIEANNRIYCSNHFCCSYCSKPIKGSQFIETKDGTLYCMDDFAKNVAARCARCSTPIIEHQVMALGKCWHPQCFLCNHCKKPIPQGQFHIKEENNQTFVYCEQDYKAFYELRCTSCKLAIDSDDKYLQVSNNNYHVECYKR